MRARPLAEKPLRPPFHQSKPWEAFGANLTDGDANAIVSYLQSLKPVRNKVPGPFGSNETPTSFVFKVLPPASGAPPR